MKYSSNDMYTSGAYFSKNPDLDVADAKWKADIIYSLLTKNKISVEEVIEVGCGGGSNLVELAKKDQGIKQLIGYDISPQAIELASQKANDRIAYINEDLAVKEYIRTELMLVIDVVEHVDDFYGFLVRLRSKSEYFIFHIPLDLSCRTIMKPHVLLQQRESVGHIHYFTKEMVDWALKETGFAILDWVYTKPVVDIDKPDTFKRWVKKILRNISFAVNKDWSVKRWGGYSMMILAK